MTSRPFTYVLFAEIWNASNSVQDVAFATGKTKQACYTLASRLRKLGMELKKMPFHVVVPISVRFWKMVSTGDGCWLWTGSTTPEGYGRIQREQRGMTPVHAHRLSYEIHFGQIPNGMDVLHKCDNPSCVRPDHLFLGTAKDNAADMARKGRGWWQKKKQKETAL